MVARVHAPSWANNILCERECARALVQFLSLRQPRNRLDTRAIRNYEKPNYRVVDKFDDEWIVACGKNVRHSLLLWSCTSICDFHSFCRSHFGINFIQNDCFCVPRAFQLNKTINRIVEDTTEYKRNLHCCQFMQKKNSKNKIDSDECAISLCRRTSQTISISLPIIQRRNSNRRKIMSTSQNVSLYIWLATHWRNPFFRRRFVSWAINVRVAAWRISHSDATLTSLSEAKK